jgi:hypothetical protein
MLSNVYLLTFFLVPVITFFVLILLCNYFNFLFIILLFIYFNFFALLVFELRSSVY